MKLSEAANSLGLDEKKLRELCTAYEVAIVRGEDGREAVAITPVLRLAADLENSRSLANKNWTLLKSSLSRVESEFDAAGTAPNTTISSIKWTDVIGALAAAGAAAAAIWAVCIASDELNRAIDAFKLGNQYQYQNDFISAFEGIQNGQPTAVVISMNERFRLGKQIEDGNGFPQGFWKDYTTTACDSLTASQCRPVPDLDTEPTVYKNTFAGYDAILDVCYAKYADNESICTAKGG